MREFENKNAKLREQKKVQIVEDTFCNSLDNITDVLDKNKNSSKIVGEKEEEIIYKMYDVQRISSYIWTKTEIEKNCSRLLACGKSIANINNPVSIA